MKAKQITLPNADGSEETYSISYLTFDQVEGLGELEAKKQSRFLVASCLGIEQDAVGKIPYIHLRRLQKECLTLNDLKAEGNAVSSGEDQTTKPSVPS